MTNAIEVQTERVKVGEVLAFSDLRPGEAGLVCKLPGRCDKLFKIGPEGGLQCVERDGNKFRKRGPINVKPNEKCEVIAIL